MSFEKYEELGMTWDEYRHCTNKRYSHLTYEQIFFGEPWPGEQEDQEEIEPMYFERRTELQAISDCGFYSISKEEPIADCFFNVARFHPDKDYRAGCTLGQFASYQLAKEACEDHKREKAA